MLKKSHPRLDFGHAKCLHDSGDELGDCAGSGLGDNDKGKDPKLVVCNGSLEGLEKRHSLLVLDTSVLLETVDGDGLLAVAQPAGTGGGQLMILGGGSLSPWGKRKADGQGVLTSRDSRAR